MAKIPVAKLDGGVNTTPSATAKPTSTNEKNAQTVAAYAAANPAPAGTHYGKNLDASGKPILYTNVSAAQSKLGAGSSTTGATGAGAGSSTTGATGAGAGSSTTGATKAGAPTAAEIATQQAADQDAAKKAISDKNALALLTSTLQGYGVDSASGSISNAILGLIQSNYDAPTIQALIESPTAATSSDANVKALAGAWNTRFSGNVAREKAGLTPLSPAEYISTENSYKAVMARAGLDAAHMDPTKLGALIGADVSPNEVNQRVNAAMAAVTAEDPFVKQQLNQQFGLTTGDLVGHLLDPTTQASIIANKVTAAQVGAEASRAGTDINAANAYALAVQGVTQAQAQQGFSSIAQQLPGTQSLANRYAGYTDQGNVGATLQTATFGQRGTQTQAQAEAELQRLKTQEVSAFSGSSGAGKGSLGISDTSGLL
jgi:hypothetical protein